MSINYLKAKVVCVGAVAVVTLAMHLDQLYPAPIPEPPPAPVLQAPLPPPPRVTYTPPLPPLPKAYARHPRTND